MMNAQTMLEQEIRKDEQRRMLLALTIIMLPDHDYLFDQVEAAFAGLAALPSQEVPAQPQREAEPDWKQDQTETSVLPATGALYGTGMRFPLAAQPQCAREAIARKIAAWIGYAWDGLPEYSVVNRSYPEWHSERRYQGGKPDLLRLADALMAQCPDEAVGREQ